jgi:hypothetical protein
LRWQDEPRRFWSAEFSKETSRMAKVRRRCSEAFIVQGAWWEPANPDQQLTGALTWSPDSGGELDLLGFFHDDSGTLGNWRGGDRFLV